MDPGTVLIYQPLWDTACRHIYGKCIRVDLKKLKVDGYHIPNNAHIISKKVQEEQVFDVKQKMAKSEMMAANIIDIAAGNNITNMVISIITTLLIGT